MTTANLPQMRNAVLLVGSAKPEDASTSHALGEALLARLNARGIAGRTFMVQRVMRTEERIQQLLAAIDAADIVVLAFPLYVDTLPYLVTAALERIARHRQETTSGSAPLFVAIVNCGFPEVAHNALALRVCRQFARQAHFDWGGGLALGGGGALNGKSPDAAGARARNIVHSLDLAADALAQGQPVPDVAVELMAQPIIPASLYMLMGDIGWVQQAWQNNVLWKLRKRPFAERVGQE